MIAAGYYGVRAVRKKYKKHQAAKQEKLDAERGPLPDIQDPSRELDARSQAKNDTLVTPTSASTQFVSPTLLNRDTSLRSSNSASSDPSTPSTHDLLENDPNFRRYMEQQRQIYLEQRQGIPPSYETATDSSSPRKSHYHSQRHHTTSSRASDLPHSPADQILSPAGTHCSCRECAQQSQSQARSRSSSASRPKSSHQEIKSPAVELPTSEHTIAELPSADLEKPKGDLSGVQSPSPVGFLSELPGNLPAMLPGPCDPDAVEMAA